MFVTEYPGQGSDNRGPLPAPRVPAIDFTFLTLTSTAQKVCVIKRNTNLVKLVSTVNAVFEIIPDAATNETLTATNGDFLPAGSPEYFVTPQEAGELAVWARTA